MKKLLILSLALSASLAIAQDATIGFHIGSQHLGKANDYNNVNPGLYGKYKGWTGGVFYNSIERVSVYGGYTFESPQWNKLSVAATVGLITGYRDGARPYPMLVPSLAWEHGFLGSGSTLRLMYLPPVRNVETHVLHLGHEWKF